MKKPLLTAVFFLIGFYSTSFQIILSREMTVSFLGNEIALSLLFFYWFAGIALGAWIFPKISESLVKEESMPILALVLILLPHLQIFLLRSARIISGIGPGEWIPISMMMLYSLACIIPFSFLIGILIPLLSRLSARGFGRGTDHGKGAAGLVYSVESLGSMAAGLLVSLLLLEYIKNEAILTSLGLISIALFFLYSLISLRSQAFKIFAFFLILLASIFHLSIAPRIDSLGLENRWRGTASSKRIAEDDSIYQNIVVAQDEDQFSLFTNGSYLGSFPDIYHFEPLAHLIMTMHPDPREVLISSAAGEGLIEFMLGHHPKHIDLVQLDAKLHGMVLEHLGLRSQDALSDSRVSLYFEDMKEFARKAEEGTRRYDLIISLPGDPRTLALNRFFTAEFYGSIRSLLKEGGIFVTAVNSNENYLSGDLGEYLGSVYATLKGVFKNTIVIPGTTAYLFSSDREGGISYDLDEIGERFEKRGIKSENFTKYNFSALLQKARIEKVSRALQSQIDSYPVNRQMAPASFIFTLKLLGDYSGRYFRKILGFLVGISLFHYLVLILLFAVTRSIYLALKRDGSRGVARFNSLFAIFTTGFSGFTLQMMLLYLYQAGFGFLYERIGLIIALFMFGLFSGSFLSNCFLLGSSSGKMPTLISCELLIVLLCLAFTPALKHFPTQAAFFALSFLSGFMTGAEFPIANGIYFEEADLTQAASFVDSADHLGAAFGAIMCGLILVPALGILETCLILAAIKSASLFFLARQLFGKR